MRNEETVSDFKAEDIQFMELGFNRAKTTRSVYWQAAAQRHRPGDGWMSMRNTGNSRFFRYGASRFGRSG